MNRDLKLIPLADGRFRKLNFDLRRLLPRLHSYFKGHRCTAIRVQDSYLERTWHTKPGCGDHRSQKQFCVREPPSRDVVGRNILSINLNNGILRESTARDLECCIRTTGWNFRWPNGA